MSIELLDVEIYRVFCKEENKWIVRVKGISSGFIVHGGYPDDMSIEFRFDANRFEPIIKKR